MSATLLQAAAWYLGAVNVLAFAVYALDKLLALRRKRRVPELTLLALAAVGGSLGSLFAMLLFRHKTNAKRHPRFAIGVPLLTLLHLSAVWFIWWKWAAQGN